MALHRLQSPRQLARERLDVRVAAEQGEAREPRRIVRDLVRLLVGHHLQPMLDAAQEDVGFAEITRDLTLDPTPRGEPAQRLQRLRHAQVRLAPAGDQLLRLHEELDLADAAAAELDVVAGDRDRAEAAIGVDLPLHGVDVGDGGKVEVLAPDEGSKLVEELAPGVEIAGAGPRLDEGRALPVLAEALVVDERGVGRERELRGARIGAQAQIRAEDVAVARALLQKLHEVARQAHEELRRLLPGRERDAIGIVEDDEVDVARIVELARAELAHGEHDVAGWRDATVALGPPLPTRRRLAEQEVDGTGERGVCAFAQCRGDGHRGPHPAEVGERREQRHLRLERAERAHGRWAIQRGLQLGRKLGAEFRQTRFGSARQYSLQAGRIALDEAAEIGRAGEDAANEIGDARLVEELSQRRQLGCSARPLTQLGERGSHPLVGARSRRLYNARAQRFGDACFNRHRPGRRLLARVSGRPAAWVCAG